MYGMCAADIVYANCDKITREKSTITEIQRNSENAVVRNTHRDSENSVVTNAQWG